MSNGDSGRPLAVTQEQLKQIVPWVRVPDGTADEINAVVDLAGISTHLELAHFIAQCTYECGYYGHYEEPYVPGRYEFRVSLGNTQPGDGQKFRGRGAIQLTGRANYEAFTAWLYDHGYIVPVVDNVDCPAEPELYATPPYRWLTAAWFWVTHPGLKAAALQDDVAMCTRIITGAKIPGPDQGLSSREKLTNAAIQALG